MCLSESTPILGDLRELPHKLAQVPLGRPNIAPFSAAQVSASPADRAFIAGAYDEELLGVDHALAALFAAVASERFGERLLVIVTSDHGEEFAEHGGFAHAHSLYNELLHVPLVIKYPAGVAAAAGARAEVAGLIDVVPTIRDVLGAAWPEAAFRGRSLLAGGGPPGPIG